MDRVETKPKGRRVLPPEQPLPDRSQPGACEVGNGIGLPGSTETTPMSRPASIAPPEGLEQYYRLNIVYVDLT
jgi:hypothetical protein